MTAAKIGRPWVDHTIIDGAYTGRLNALTLQIAKALDEEERAPSRLAESRLSLSLAAEHDALSKEAELSYRIMALPRRRWSDLKDAHPPRKSAPVDDGDLAVNAADMVGVDTSTFFDAVMPETVVDSESDPRVASPRFMAKECAEHFGEFSASDWNDLCSMVWAINERGVGAPKSSMVSFVRQQIGDDSEPQETSASPSPASTGGSRLAGASSST